MIHHEDINPSGGIAPPESPLVLHVIDNLGVGGAQALLVHMASPDQPRIRFRVLSLGQRSSALSERLADMGVTIETIPPRRRANPLGWMTLIRHIARSQAPIVHLHLSTAIIQGAPVAKLLRKKVVVSLHNARHGSPGGRTVRAAEAISLNLFADRILAVGAQVRDSYAEAVRHRRIEFLPNVVAPFDHPGPGSRMRVRASLGADEHDIVLISTGRFHPLKDHLTMVRGFAELRRRRDDVWLWLLGDGTTRPSIEAEIARLGIGDRVHVLGARPDVHQLLAASDVFVLTSSSEGLPLGVLEALAAGLPVVATRVGDIPQVVPSGAGLLIPPGDPGALADALARLCEGPSLRHGFASGAAAAGRRHTDVVAWKKAMLGVYIEALAGTAPTAQTQSGR